MDNAKTTLSGAVSGLIVLALSIFGYFIDANTIQLITSIAIAVGAIGIALVGFFAKDWKISTVVSEIDKAVEAWKAIPNEKISEAANDLDIILDAINDRLAELELELEDLKKTPN